MIKTLIEDQVDFKIRKSNINLASFNSYFKKITRPPVEEAKVINQESKTLSNGGRNSS